MAVLPAFLSKPGKSRSRVCLPDYCYCEMRLMNWMIALLVTGLLLGGCATSSPAPRRAVQVDPESPAGRAAQPDPNLYRQQVAGIRLRDSYTVSVERLAQEGFEVKDQPSLTDVERTTGAQLIAFRDVPGARTPSRRASEMLVLQYCYGRVASVTLRTSMDDDDLARAREADAATLPPMRVESHSDRQEVRRYSTNKLSAINLVYGVGTRQSHFYPNERSIMLSDQNWCAMEDVKRR